MDIKMIVSDLDGTLFNSDEENYEISPELITEVEGLKKKGIIFTISTGRPEYSSRAVIEKFNIKVPYIIYNGAVVVDEYGQAIYNRYFKLNSFKGFLYTISESGGTVLLYLDKRIYYIKFTDKIPIYEKKEKVKCELIDPNIDWDNLKANKILLIWDIKSFKSQWQKLDTSFREEFRYVISEYNYFEILKNGVSKGEALKFLKKYLNVPDDGGKVCWIPFQRSSIVLYYNKDAFKEAGLEPENAPKNWEELEEC